MRAKSNPAPSDTLAIALAPDGHIKALLTGRQPALERLAFALAPEADPTLVEIIYTCQGHYELYA